MWRLVLIIVALLAAAATALAATPNVNHFDFSGTFTDPDFCGTGVAIDGSFSGHGDEWFAPRNVDYRAVVQGRTVLTNPLNGKTVVQHFANQFTETILSEGAEEGDYTAYQTFKVSRSCGRPSAVLY